MGTDLSKYDNYGYHPGGSIIKRCLWFVCNSIVFKTSLMPFWGPKVRLLRIFGARVGKGVVIKPNVNIKYPWHLEIGDYVWLGENCWIDNLTTVKIGNNSCLSQGACLVCGNHDYKDPHFGLMVQEILLEEGVWIGAKAIVCGGTVCHRHSVLLVGSVAKGDLPEYGIYQGNPAIKVRERVFR